MKTKYLKTAMALIVLTLLIGACKKNTPGNTDDLLLITLISPANASSNLASPVTLTCQPVTNASTYTFTVTDANTGTQSTKTGVTPTATFTLPSGQAYVWSVQAYTTAGETYHSTQWSFAVATGGAQPDSTPVVLEPTDLAQGICTQSTFRWRKAAGAQSYQIELDSSYYNYYRIAFSATVSDTSYTMPPGALKPGMKYELHIKASGTGYESATTFTATAPPSQLTPGNNAVGVGTTPTLTWSPQGCTNTYTVSVFRQYNHIMVGSPQQVTGTSATVPPNVLSSGVTYVWEVKAAGDNVYLSEFAFTP